MTKSGYSLVQALEVAVPVVHQQHTQRKMKNVLMYIDENAVMAHG